MSIEKLLEKHTYKPHIIERYFKFCSNVKNIKIKGETHHHHILPKAKDFFPEYSDLSTYPWNGVHLTHREHFIAHRMLAIAFPKSSQSIAFYNMCNNNKITKSLTYEIALAYHKECVKLMTQCPERNRKISEALKGKKKSPEHIANLMGRPMSDITRKKLREAKLGKKHTEESCCKMSESRRGVKRNSHSTETIQKIKNTKNGQRWYNNGIIQTMSSSKPEGWVKGRLPKRKY